jgi:hypothetical protein
MADITLVAPIRLASPHGLGRITAVAAEAFDLTSSEIAGYVADDGLIYRAVSVAAGDTAIFDGLVVRSCTAGEKITLFQQGYKIRIGAHGLAIGAFFYPSDTAGLLSDTAIGAGEQPIAKAISATEIEITRMDLPVIDNS